MDSSLSRIASVCVCLCTGKINLFFLVSREAGGVYGIRHAEAKKKIGKKGNLITCVFVTK